MALPFVILGAGITGLSLAWYLKKKFPHIPIIIIEKSSRPGGWIQTITLNDFLFELGPRGLRPKGNGFFTLQLIEELGITNEVITPLQSVHRRYLYIQENLHPIPNGFKEYVTSPLMSGLTKALLNDLLTSKSSLKDESVYSFFSRRLSSQFAETFVDPLISGIFAGDPKELSIKSCFPSIYEMEQTHRSLLKAAFFSKKKKRKSSEFIKQIEKNSLYSFKRGMETLPKELANQLDATFIYDCSVTKIHDGCSLTLDNGQTIHARHIFSSLPASETAKLFDQSVSSILEEIQQSSVAVVNVGFKKNVLKRNGYGYLIPSSEKESVLGMVWDSCLFPQQSKDENETRITVMIGGTKMQDFDGYSEMEFCEIASHALHKHLGISETAEAMYCKIAKRAITQYSVGHSEKLDLLDKELEKYPWMTLLGSSYHGVAVNDCVAKAYQVVMNLNNE